MFSLVKPFQHVAIRLPSDNVKIEHITPNTHVNLGKFGSFNTNSIIGRPYHLTYEILEKAKQVDGNQLRVIPSAEIHADTLLEEAESSLQDGANPDPEFDEYGLPSTDKTNVAIFDNQENQKLTLAEIEAMKADQSANAKDLIAKIMANNSQLDQKTAFSLAKYTVRKHKKYMKRFTVLPLDVATLLDCYMYEKDFSKIMEIRNETLSLIGSWANVHAAVERTDAEAEQAEPECRYLVVDDTGGLVVAALAERMGILHNTALTQTQPIAEEELEAASIEHGHNDEDAQSEATNGQPTHSVPFRRHRQNYRNNLATSNTLTVIHSNQQPNLSLLRYFNYDPNLPPGPSDPNPHPLHSHLKLLSWLQLIDPESDTTYEEPPAKTPEELRTLKSNARSTYYRKRRRWERCKSIVDEARSGGFNALVIVSYTNPTSILQRLVPLLTGGAQIVVYSPHIEPLLTVADACSTAHRSAFLNLSEAEREAKLGTTDFPLDPTLTLGFMVQTARVRKWQVLPGRTHPLMTQKGAAEGYIASATRVLPAKGKIEARGKQGGKRRGKKADVGLADLPGDGDEMVLDSSEEAEMEESERKRTKLENGSSLDVA